jgi:hypothetical protein
LKAKIYVNCRFSPEAYTKSRSEKRRYDCTLDGTVLERSKQTKSLLEKGQYPAAENLVQPIIEEVTAPDLVAS